MSPEANRAYQRGYAAGLKRSWPACGLIKDDPNLVADLVAAAKQLRDTADHSCATLTDDDDLVKLLAPYIDTFDKELADYNQRVTQPMKEETHDVAYGQ